MREAVVMLAPRIAGQIRDLLIAGAFRPGQRLSETSLSAELTVSRNTLREAFRLLTAEGLLRHEPNRGVFVATPTMESIVDIYRVRRLIEGQALAQAFPEHPAVRRMRAAVDKATACRKKKDWQGVGSANMTFHAAIVEFADSPRLAALYEKIAAELRLSFGLIENPELLFAPFVDLNTEIIALLEAGRIAAAVKALDAYLVRSERAVLAALARAAVP